MKLAALIIFLFNFVFSYSAKAETVSTHECTEIVIQLESDLNSEGLNSACPLEPDEEDVDIESADDLKFSILPLNIQAQPIPENHFIDEQFQPPNLI